MKRRQIWSDQRGEVNTLTVPLILSVVLLLGAIVFGAWAFNSRQDYRNNTNQKISVAVKSARADEDIIKDNEHAEADKQPLKSYKGPEAYGGVQVYYPKTWSGYVIDSGSSISQPVDGYFHPGVVPNIADRDKSVALHVQVINSSYTTEVASLKEKVSSGKATAAAYTFPKVPSVVGIRFDGQVIAGKDVTGSKIMVPLRDKTLEVWTESPLYLPDFNNNILPNLTFSP